MMTDRRPPSLAESATEIATHASPQPHQTMRRRKPPTTVQNCKLGFFLHCHI